MLKDLVAPTIWREWFDHFMHNTFDDDYDAANAIGLLPPPMDCPRKLYSIQSKCVLV